MIKIVIKYKDLACIMSGNCLILLWEQKLLVLYNCTTWCKITVPCTYYKKYQWIKINFISFTEYWHMNNFILGL